MCFNYIRNLNLNVLLYIVLLVLELLNVLQKKLNIPIIFSATRGVHKRMLKDLQTYTKFFAISKNAPKKDWAVSQYRKTMKKSGIKTQQMSKPRNFRTCKNSL